MVERRSPVDVVAGEVARAVLRGIDPDAVVRQVDVDAIAARIDVNRLLADLDLDALLARVDVEAVAERIDVDAVAARIDVNALAARLDVDAIVDRLDVEAIAERVPIERIIGTPELQRAVDSVDLGPALRRAGLADIVAQSLGQTSLDTVRRRLVVVDAFAERLIGSVLRQDLSSWPAGPEELVGEETGPLGELDGELDGEQAFNVTGHHVGPLGRVLATVLDAFGSFGTYTLLTSTLASLATFLFADLDTSGDGVRVAFVVGLVLYVATWFLLPLEVIGRTPAMSLLGVRVVTRDGGVPSFPQLVLRSLVQVPSVLLLGVGYVPTLVDRRRRAVHDLVAGTAVVWDWGDRQASINSPLGRWVAGSSS